MTKEELQKLRSNLKKRLVEIDKELSVIASENPLVKGDFNVKVEDLGKSQEDTEQEAGELDRNQAMVNTLEKERKDIENTLEKIEAGTYGKCESCSTNINPARLKAVPVASLCISCAKKHKSS
ncbi:MAG: TraR/DksA family transcriptional regulator [Candidatus Taylorbacteria bacterium]|nr:TraR/DksA family transcriptional regulator [Candidatus Taylorbacteria bacterium]